MVVVFVEFSIKIRHDDRVMRARYFSGLFSSRRFGPGRTVGAGGMRSGTGKTCFDDGRDGNTVWNFLRCGAGILPASS